MPRALSEEALIGAVAVLRRLGREDDGHAVLAPQLEEAVQVRDSYLVATSYSLVGELIRWLRRDS